MWSVQQVTHLPRAGYFTSSASCIDTVLKGPTCYIASHPKDTCNVNELALVLKRRSNKYHTRNAYSLLLLVKFLHLYNMPGPRIEPRKTKYKADMITGHRDKHYTTVPPTAIMMNKPHADIHHMVSKPVGISHLYAIRHMYVLSDIYD